MRRNFVCLLAQHLPDVARVNRNDRQNVDIDHRQRDYPRGVWVCLPRCGRMALATDYSTAIHKLKTSSISSSVL